jgi:hypothetical protein
MTSNEYVMNVVRNHALPAQLDTNTVYYVVNPLKRVIAEWAGSCLCETKLSGSRAKGTAIDLSTDLDLFISLTSNTTNSLKEIYDSLYNWVTRKGITARKQNVSIGITYGGQKIDLVPAKRQGQYGNDHSLYRSKADTWTKTNIDTHISRVNNSGRRNEIIALKVWRENHRLEFPSIYLETLAIDALSGRHSSDTASNFLYLLRYIGDNIGSLRVVDPANSNNILSDDFTAGEKRILSTQAQKSLTEQYWKQIIW